MEDNNEQFTNDLSSYLKELAEYKYQSEIRREDSLIAQAGNMQTAFAFTSAALCMVAAIAVDYKEPWSYEFLLVVFSSIMAFLLGSLVLATKAQERTKREDFEHIENIVAFVKENFEDSDTIAKRNIQWVDMLTKVETDLSRTNDNKVFFIIWSMRLFYIAIGLSIIWFIVAMIIM